MPCFNIKMIYLKAYISVYLGSYILYYLALLLKLYIQKAVY